MIKPITPQEALNYNHIPDEVMIIWNIFVAKAIKGNGVIYQEDVINTITKETDYSRDDIFKCNLLDVEELYRKVGFEVTYDKPAYNETYEATFTFKIPKW